MQIPFHKPYIGDAEIESVVDSLRSGWLTTGPKTMKFEEDFKQYIGAPHAVALSSCTAALHLALRALGLGEGDEVIIPTLTFASTGEVITYFNATPVLVDIDRDTGLIDISQIEKRITSNTKAVIPVHYAGQPCDMDEISALAEQRDIRIVEDAAHSLPAAYKGRRIGTIGDITCFSFYAVKTLTTGEGGMATTADADWAEKIRILRLHGISKDAWKRYSSAGSWYYEITDVGYKYNMMDIQAAMGIEQLKKLEAMLQLRASIASRYTEAFSGCDSIITPTTKEDRETSWHLYPIRLDLDTLSIDRNTYIEKLKEKGIGTSVHFIPLHRHPLYKTVYGYKPDSFPNAEWNYERNISLPIFPGMKDDEVNYVIEGVIAIARQCRR